MLTKLALNAEPQTVASAQRMAAEQGTSVSALFADLITSLAKKGRHLPAKDAPITRRLRGVMTLPPGKTDRELLEGALLEKYARAWLPTSATSSTSTPMS